MPGRSQRSENPLRGLGGRDRCAVTTRELGAKTLIAALCQTRVFAKTCVRAPGRYGVQGESEPRRAEALGRCRVNALVVVGCERSSLSAGRDVCAVWRGDGKEEVGVEPSRKSSANTASHGVRARVGAVAHSRAVAVWLCNAEMQASHEQSPDDRRLRRLHESRARDSGDCISRPPGCTFAKATARAFPRQILRPPRPAGAAGAYSPAKLASGRI
jgi:hypothetical protein